MNENNEKPVENVANSDKKPVDENMGFYFSSAIKIYDPDTQEVLVQLRGDN